MTDCLTYTSIAPTGPELEADWQAARNNPLGITTRLWALGPEQSVPREAWVPRPYQGSVVPRQTTQGG